MKKNGKKKEKSSVQMVDVPYAQVAVYRGQPASTRMLSKRRGLCRGSDLVQALSGSTSFSAARVRFNPGLSTFASLSIEASRYDKYRVRKLRMVYYPDVAVVTTAGRVYLAAEYDNRDDAPSTLAKLLTYEGNVNEVVHKPLVLDIDPRIMFSGTQFKRNRCGPVAGDLELYDACSLIIATDNCANTNALGQVMVEYEIEFDAFQLEPGVFKPQAYALWGITSSQSLTSGVAVAVEFDEAIVDGLNVTPATGVFTMPCGTYAISGELCVVDTSAETLQINVDLQKDGASLSPNQQSLFKYTSIASGYTMVPFTFYFTSTGSNTMNIRVTATGAAGTLSLPTDNNRISIRAI